MLFDTDVLIWVLRGNPKAARTVEDASARALSIVSYMELLQGARDKREMKAIRSFLADFAFEVVPLSENIGHRAAIYMEQYALKGALRVADALIGATGVETGRTLCSANRKHYRPISDLDLRIFRP